MESLVIVVTYVANTEMKIQQIKRSELFEHELKLLISFNNKGAWEPGFTTMEKLLFLDEYGEDNSRFKTSTNHTDPSLPISSVVLLYRE